MGGNVSGTPLVTHAGIETYDTYLATDAAGSGGPLVFLLGVSFGNVLDAALTGSMTSLPVINHYEHFTFFIGGHGAMFGVKANIALASILFYVQHVI